MPHGSHKLSHGIIQGEDHGVGTRIKSVRHLEPGGQMGSDQLPGPTGHPLRWEVEFFQRGGCATNESEMETQPPAKQAP